MEIILHKPLLGIVIILIVWSGIRLLCKKKQGQDIRRKRKKLLFWMLAILVYYCTLDLILAPTMGLVVKHSSAKLLDNKLIWKYVQGGQRFREIMDEADIPETALYNMIVVDAGYRRTLFAGPWKPNVFIAQYKTNEEYFAKTINLLQKDENQLKEFEEGNYRYIEINFQLGVAYNYEKQLLWIVYNNDTTPPPAGSRYWIDYYDVVEWE